MGLSTSIVTEALEEDPSAPGVYSLHRVEYVSDYPDWPVAKLLNKNMDIFDKAVLTKSDEWRHEDEIRIHMLQNLNRTGKRPLECEERKLALPPKPSPKSSLATGCPGSIARR